MKSKYFGEDLIGSLPRELKLETSNSGTLQCTRPFQGALSWENHAPSRDGHREEPLREEKVAAE
jgi:hypothetical protein